MLWRCQLQGQWFRRSGRDYRGAFRWLTLGNDMQHTAIVLGSILAMQFVSPTGILNAVAGSALEFPRPAGYVPTEEAGSLRRRTGPTAEASARCSTCPST